MPQYTFTSEKVFIEEEVQRIADKENRSRSEMIDLLLRQAVKERTRKRNAKQNTSQYNSPDLGTSNSTG